MTIAGRKNAVSKGTAKLLVRVVRPCNGPRLDWRSFYKPEARPQHILVEFNPKDELELQFTIDKDEIPKNNKENINTINIFEGKRIIKIESFKIDDIVDCISNDTNDFKNTLIVEILKKNLREELVLKFESEQEFRRTLFTYKYFKMRNRLTNSSSSEMSDGSSSPSLSTKSKSSISSLETGSNQTNYNKAFDYSTNNGVTSHYVKNFSSDHNNYTAKSLDYITMTGQIQKNKQVFEQKIKEMNDNNNKNNKSLKYEYNSTNGNGGSKVDNKSKDIGEIDGLIYTDIEYESMDYPSMNYGNFNNQSSEVPLKPQRRKQLLRRIKGKAPPPPGGGAEVVRGQVVKISVERGEKIPTKEHDAAPLKNTPSVPRAHMGSNGYESDREEWRSRSTFSSSAFHSLARPARRALAVYYRLSSSPAPVQTPQPQVLMKPNTRNPRSLQEYPKSFVASNPDFVILSQMQDNKRTNFAPNYQQDFNKLSYQNKELKYGKLLFNQDYKRNTLGGSMNYLNISNRLYGLTDKLKEIGSGQQNHAKQIWQSKPEKEKKEKGQLKPVIKKNLTQEGSKRPVVRTCSAEPPKKVTFSAFATVQVV